MKNLKQIDLPNCLLFVLFRTPFGTTCRATTALSRTISRSDTGPWTSACAVGRNTTLVSEPGDSALHFHFQSRDRLPFFFFFFQSRRSFFWSFYWHVSDTPCPSHCVLPTSCTAQQIIIKVGDESECPLVATLWPDWWCHRLITSSSSSFIKCPPSSNWRFWHCWCMLGLLVFP